MYTIATIKLKFTNWYPCWSCYTRQLKKIPFCALDFETGTGFV